MLRTYICCIKKNIVTPELFDHPVEMIFNVFFLVFNMFISYFLC